MLFLELLGGAARQFDQILSPIHAADRDDQPPADLQLRLDGRRNLLCAGGDENRIELSIIGPTQGSIAVPKIDAAKPDFGYDRGGG
jgi:hypothetical protein